MAAPRVVVFDLGEVLATPVRLLSRMAARAGVDAARLEVAYWAHRDPHDLGQPATEYWTQVLGSVGVGTNPDLLTELAADDSSSWTTLRPDALALLVELRAAGERLAILSNAPREFAAVARRSVWGDCVDDWFFSGELGLAKPDPALYALVGRDLQVDGPDILFFDDRPVNVAGAAAAGWDAVLWQPGPSTRAHLVSRGLLR